jgi:CheY-like chemotaxis protein/RimJ/RimL family protein N-acetyltransferase
MAPPTIVHVADSDETMTAALATLLGCYGITVHTATTGDGLLGDLSGTSGDHRCLLLAERLAEGPGLELLDRIREAGHDFPVVLLADKPDEALRQAASEAGAADVVDRPLVAAYLFARLAELLPGSAALPVVPPSTMELEDGTRVTLRMMRPEDAAMEQAFVTSLSDRSRYLRFFSGLKQLPPFMLRELTNPRFPASYALIATIPGEGDERQIGVARYAPTDEPGSGEFAVVIADEWQGRGIASQLMRGITVAASVAGLSQLEGLVLAENRPMLALAASLGFSEKPYPDDPALVRVVKRLGGKTD